MENVDMSKMYPGYGPGGINPSADPAGDGFTGGGEPPTLDAEFEEVTPSTDPAETPAEDGEDAPAAPVATSEVNLSPMYASMRLDVLAIATPEDCAGLLGTTVATLSNWRKQGQGPRFFFIGKRVYYHMSDVAGWVAKYEPVGGGDLVAKTGAPNKPRRKNQIDASESKAIREAAGNVQQHGQPVTAELGARVDAVDPVTHASEAPAVDVADMTLDEALSPNAAVMFQKYMEEETAPEEAPEPAAEAPVAPAKRPYDYLPDIDAMEFEEDDFGDTSTAEV